MLRQISGEKEWQRIRMCDGDALTVDNDSPTSPTEVVACTQRFVIPSDNVEPSPGAAAASRAC